MTRQIIVGGVPIGGGAPVVIQSMLNTMTTDVEGSLAQIRALKTAGCQIARLAVPNKEAAVTLGWFIASSFSLGTMTIWACAVTKAQSATNMREVMRILQPAYLSSICAYCDNELVSHISACDRCLCLTCLETLDHHLGAFASNLGNC